MDAITAQIEQLQATGDYRVLRKLKLQPVYAEPDGQEHLGLIVDTETTGLNTATDKIFEIALQPFYYTDSGLVTRTTPGYSALGDPGVLITEEITEITGVTSEMVAGKAFDRDAINRIVSPATLVIAHNADFDRRMLEREFEIFKTKPWACSFKQVPWTILKVRSAKLDYIAMTAGLFYEAHRALADCEALLHIMAVPSPQGSTPFSHLLASHKEPQVRIYAVGSPFDSKDKLRERRYVWNPEGQGRYTKCWSKKIRKVDVQDELVWLSANVYGRSAINLPVEEISPLNRYSIRE